MDACKIKTMFPGLNKNVLLVNCLFMWWPHRVIMVMVVVMEMCPGGVRVLWVNGIELVVEFGWLMALFHSRAYGMDNQAPIAAPRDLVWDGRLHWRGLQMYTVVSDKPVGTADELGWMKWKW